MKNACHFCPITPIWIYRHLSANSHKHIYTKIRMLLVALFQLDRPDGRPLESLFVNYLCYASKKLHSAKSRSNESSPEMYMVRVHHLFAIFIALVCLAFVNNTSTINSFSSSVPTGIYYIFIIYLLGLIRHVRLILLHFIVIKTHVEENY
jgi:hypothetical protein